MVTAAVGSPDDKFVEVRHEQEALGTQPLLYLAQHFTALSLITQRETDDCDGAGTQQRCHTVFVILPVGFRQQEWVRADWHALGRGPERSRDLSRSGVSAK